MTPGFVLAVAMLLGAVSGAASWLLICTQRFGIQTEPLMPAFRQFWSVVQDPSLRFWAVIPMMVAFACMMAVLVGMSETLASMPPKRRGSRIVQAKSLMKLTKDRGVDVVQVTLGGIPLPVHAETSHILLVGSTGTGKSNGQSELMASALARSDRLIVVDPNGAALSRHFKPGDRILNPMDARAEGWSVFNEIQRPSDYERLALAMIPRGTGDDETWREKARAMLSDLLKAVTIHDSDCTPSRLLWWAAAATTEQLKAPLAGTTSEALLLPDGGKPLDSVRSVMSKYVGPHDKHPVGDFSLHRWLKEEEGNLYITWRDDQLTTLRPLVNFWLSWLITEVLSSSKPQPLWLFIDELGSLEAITGLEAALTKGRKHGLRVVACLQSTAQLTDAYGKSAAETLRSCFRTMLVLGGSVTDPDTAEAMSKGLGDVETEQRELSVSVDGTRRSTTDSLQVRTSRLVLASEIQTLPVNVGYLKLPGDLPAARVRVKPPVVAVKATAFEER